MDLLAAAIKITLLFSFSIFGLSARAQSKEAALLKELNKKLITAENSRDEKFVNNLIWKSPNAVFVAKTKEEDSRVWAGFWGADIVKQHLHDVMYGGTFTITPDYDSEKAAMFNDRTGETYLPVKISVNYGGQNPVPKPFILMVIWVKTGDGWKMASDIAIPVPQGK